MEPCMLQYRARPPTPPPGMRRRHGLFNANPSCRGSICWALSLLPQRQRLGKAAWVVAGAAPSAGPSPSAPDPGWWDHLNRKNLKGTTPPPEPMPPLPENWSRRRMGERTFKAVEDLRRSERQRVWDNMRRIAGERYQRGEMPAWFKPEWLEWEEAPTNTFWRQLGREAYWQDDTWLGSSAPPPGGGEGGGGGSGGGSGRGGWRWWREEDPYWPMRDWGDHPMRWWTWGFAALLAAGGLLSFLVHGSTESVRVGFPAAALLALSAFAMSDMTNGSALGELGVKAAWGTCALFACKEYWWGWDFERRRDDHHGGWSADGGRQPGLGWCGWGSLAMCVLYMWTGMSGLSQYALPMNPGEAFKLVDVAQKHKVWESWGYADVPMR